MLSVREGARAVEFYKAAFGAVEVFRIEDPSGAVVSRLAVEGAEFWLADESPAHLQLQSRVAGRRHGADDPDRAGSRRDVCESRGRQERARSSRWRKPTDGAWAVSVDPFGHHWEIGRPLAGALSTQWERDSMKPVSVY